MTDIDLKALRDEAEFQQICGRSDWPRGASISGNDMITLLDRLESAERRAEEAEKECAAQARLVGMGAERELALMAKLGKAENERDALRKDAGRYAFVRMAATSEDERYQDAMAREAERFDGRIPDSDMFDEMVDAVMAQEGGK